MRNERKVPLDLTYKMLDDVGDLKHIYRKIESEDFEGVLAQRVWISYELANVFANLAVARKHNNDAYEADVNTALEWIDRAYVHHQEAKGNYNKNNAKWLREEFIIENMALLKAMILDDFRSQALMQTALSQLICDFYEFELFVLLDDPLFKRNGGVEYVDKNCPNI